MTQVEFYDYDSGFFGGGAKCRANISGANLLGAKLLGAKLPDYNYDNTSPPKLDGATMPDGTVYQGENNK